MKKFFLLPNCLPLQWSKYPLWPPPNSMEPDDIPQNPQVRCPPKTEPSVLIALPIFRQEQIRVDITKILGKIRRIPN